MKFRSLILIGEKGSGRCTKVTCACNDLGIEVSHLISYKKFLRF